MAFSEQQGLIKESANLVLAGPATGSAAFPTFRSLVSADLPASSSASFGRKVISTTTYSTISSDTGKALDVQTSSPTTISLSSTFSTPSPIQHAIGTASNPTLNLAYPSNNTAGNFLVACVRFYNTGSAGSYTLVDSNSQVWSKVPSGFLDHGASSIDMWYFPNCAGAANTVTIHTTVPNNPNPEMAILEYSNVVLASPLDTSASAQSGANSNAPNSGNITTAQSVELLIGFCVNETAGGLTNTPGSGWNARVSDGDMFVCDQITSSAGTYSFNSTLSSSVAWGAYVAAFKVAPAAGVFFSGFIQNNGSSTVTVQPDTGLINGAASISIAAGAGVTIATDNTDYTAVI